MKEFGISYDSLSLATKEWLEDCKDFDDSMEELNKIRKEKEENKKVIKKHDPNKYKLFYDSI